MELYEEPLSEFQETPKRTVKGILLTGTLMEPGKEVEWKF